MGGRGVVYTHKNEFDETQFSFEVLGGFLGMWKGDGKGVHRLFFLLFVYLRHDGLECHD